MPDPRPVIVPIQVRWRDLDALGHINNAVYLSYFEVARMAYLQAMLPQDAELDPQTSLPRDFQFILADLQITYRAPAQLNDPLQASVYVSQVGQKSFIFQFRIENALGAPDRRRFQHTSVLRLCCPTVDPPAGGGQGPHGGAARCAHLAEALIQFCWRGRRRLRNRMARPAAAARAARAGLFAPPSHTGEGPDRWPERRTSPRTRHGLGGRSSRAPTAPWPNSPGTSCRGCGSLPR